MKYLSCEHRFRDEIYDRFPECFSLDTKEIPDEKMMDIGDEMDEVELGIS